MVQAAILQKIECFLAETLHYYCCAHISILLLAATKIFGSLIPMIEKCHTLVKSPDLPPLYSKEKYRTNKQETRFGRSSRIPFLSKICWYTVSDFTQTRVMFPSFHLFLDLCLRGVW